MKFILTVLGIVLLAIAGVYFLMPADQLPGFFPGHAAHATKHHYKHGVAVILLALLALGAAWFTTAPERSPD